MSPLLGPILAQLVTLGVSDRTEGRYIHSDEKYYEASTSPRIGLIFGWKHTTLSLGYGPSFTVTPLDSDERQLLIFHNAAISVSHRWRRTTVTATQAVGFGEVDFQTLALADPRTAAAPMTGDKPGATNGNAPPANGGATTGTGTATGTGTGVGTNVPGMPATAQVAATNQVVKFATTTTTVNVTQLVTPVLSVSGEVGYVLTGSIGGDSANYPVVKGPRALVSAAYRLTPHDDVTSSLTGQYAASSTGNDAWIAVATESYGHTFDPETSARAAAGISMTRNSLLDGTISYSIFPTFSASIVHNTALDRGTLSFGLGAGSGPVLDPLRAAVDPRFTLNAFLGWGLDRFSTALNGGTALSLAEPDSPGALSSATSSFSVAYRLGACCSVNSGVRAAWQNYQGQTTVPLSWAAFLGLNVGGVMPLNSPH